ncbi:MAG: hypothetical protein ACI8YQ_002769 [Polaribacter sp.]|jgi:hypothetical protein
MKEFVQQLATSSGRLAKSHMLNNISGKSKKCPSKKANALKVNSEHSIYFRK